VISSLQELSNLSDGPASDLIRESHQTFRPQALSTTAELANMSSQVLASVIGSYSSSSPSYKTRDVSARVDVVKIDLLGLS
jgi:hypothetical protein